ncbi:MAG: tetratricopeptide repeat protein [Terriglobia bacterium]
MEPSRIEILQQTLQRAPENAFARYALALELSRSSEPLRAWEHFEHLLVHQPDYAPVYLQAGLYLMKQGRPDEARKVLHKGIEVNNRQGNLHAQSELEAALEDLSAE